MKKLTRTETAAFLAANDGFAILTHRRPDGDTLGSAVLLCRGLRQLGKAAYILENPEITPKYAPLHKGLTMPSMQEGDVLVAVDTASKGMLPEAFAHLADTIALRIDHHGTAESFTDWELVEPEAAACGEIVYAVLQELGVTLDEPMADVLYTAVSTDTGCFRYANTTPIFDFVGDSGKCPGGYLADFRFPTFLVGRRSLDLTGGTQKDGHDQYVCFVTQADLNAGQQTGYYVNSTGHIPVGYYPFEGSYSDRSFHYITTELNDN